MKRKNYIAFILSVITVLCVCFAGSGCSGGVNSFTGNRIKNPDRLYMDISYMNGKAEHNLYLKQGDVLSVIFETTDGKLTIEIKDPNGEVFYSGNGKDVTEFTLNVKKRRQARRLYRSRKSKGKNRYQKIVGQSSYDFYMVR